MSTTTAPSNASTTTSPAPIPIVAGAGGIHQINIKDFKTNTLYQIGKRLFIVARFDSTKPTSCPFELYIKSTATDGKVTFELQKNQKLIVRPQDKAGVYGYELAKVIHNTTAIHSIKELKAAETSDATVIGLKESDQGTLPGFVTDYYAKSLKKVGPTLNHSTKTKTRPKLVAFIDEQSNPPRLRVGCEIEGKPTQWFEYLSSSTKWVKADVKTSPFSKFKPIRIDDNKFLITFAGQAFTASEKDEDILKRFAKAPSWFDVLFNEDSMPDKEFLKHAEELRKDFPPSFPANPPVGSIADFVVAAKKTAHHQQSEAVNAANQAAEARKNAEDAANAEAERKTAEHRKNTHPKDAEHWWPPEHQPQQAETPANKSAENDKISFVNSTVACCTLIGMVGAWLGFKSTQSNDPNKKPVSWTEKVTRMGVIGGAAAGVAYLAIHLANKKGGLSK